MNQSDLGDQFIWWTGVVESRQDPLKVGRCQVRIAGSHTEVKSIIPTNFLPWAQVILPPNDSASLQIKEGDYVVGFYLDGSDRQVPIIMGILPGIPVAQGSITTGFSDPRTGPELSSAPRKPGASPSRHPIRLNEPTFSRLSRNEKITDTPVASKKIGVKVAVPEAGGGVWNEPPTPYGTVYPYNRVMETESGHILEFDDTPGAERIHIYHRSGTFEEVHPDGTKVTHIEESAYEIVLSDKKVFIKGDLSITTGGNLNLKAGQSVNIEAGLNIVLNSLGSVVTQAALGIFTTTVGPMAFNGLPINWNGPPVVVLPPPIPVSGV